MELYIRRDDARLKTISAMLRQSGGESDPATALRWALREAEEIAKRKLGLQASERDPLGYLR